MRSDLFDTVRSTSTTHLLLLGLCLTATACVSSGRFNRHAAVTDNRIDALERQVVSQVSRLEASIQILGRDLSAIRTSQTGLQDSVVTLLSRWEGRLEELADRVGEIRLALLELERERARQRPRG